MKNYTIRPINTGFVSNYPKLYHYHPSTHKYHPELSDEAELYPVFCFLVEGNGKKILVDTGMCDTERAGKYHHPGSVQGKGQKIYEQLAQMGVMPEQIDAVILTHLHWDHMYYLEKFSCADFYVHEKELQFALDPIPLYYKSYEAPALGIERPFEHISFLTCRDETEILEGIVVFDTPGHSPGHMSVEVNTRDGKYIIGGDSAFRLDNFQAIPDIHYDVTPPGRFYNIVESWKSLEKTKKRALDLNHILLTHEKSLIQRVKHTPVLGI